MRVLVYRRYSKRYVIFIIVLFVLITAVMLKVALIAPSQVAPSFHALAAVVTAVSIAIVLFAFRNYRAEDNALGALPDQVMGWKIVFPAQIEYEVGVYRSRGEWRRGGRGNYVWSHSFDVRSRGMGSEVELPEGPFLITVKRNGDGFIEFPALRIVSGPGEGLLMLVATREGEVTGSGRIVATWENDEAELVFEGRGKTIEGSVYGNLLKARKAKVEIFHSALESNVFRIGEGINFSFSKRLLPEDDVLIIAHRTISPRELLRLLVREDPFGEDGFECIAGHGRYGIRLALDVPLRLDIGEEGKFEVVLRKSETK
ncbi:hypothetical protein [Thermococcus gammatolerans]|uniref:Uncharacterized protein n=1 Tax=Thermococcus gammatolerans (strain DSM 15229 / JCM 11827 / EJ3) TaxID=593117 RepID=C5A5E1_THEGJ|nr:hypothetical protein [Thermococcus gammatolerans]ACS33453.1 Conserved hypothetical protein [Thermococcus gammatolerans EJ3]